MKKTNKVIMLSPDINGQGGIASVVNTYQQYGLNFIHMATHKNGSKQTKIVVFLKFLFQYLFVLLTNKNIEIVHLHSASFGSFFRKFIAFCIAKIFNKKIIFNIHPIFFTVFYRQSNFITKKMIRWVLDNSDVILVLSDVIKAKVSEMTTNKDIRVIYNPVFIKEIKTKQNEKVRVLTLGKLCKAKGTYEILQAEQLLNDNIVVDLYGDGDLETFRKLNHNPDKIKINGWISGAAKDEVLENCDIYILPSHNEGLPMGILEAMSLGIPVISTPVGGVPDAVQDGVNGYLIEVGDFEALATKINILAEDENLRLSMGREGHKLAKEKFDVTLIVKQLEALYDELLK